MSDWNTYFDGGPSKGPWRTTWKGTQMSMQLDVLGLGTLCIRMSSKYTDARGKLVPEGMKLLLYGHTAQDLQETN